MSDSYRISKGPELEDIFEALKARWDGRTIRFPSDSGIVGSDGEKEIALLVLSIAAEYEPKNTWRITGSWTDDEGLSHIANLIYNSDARTGQAEIERMGIWMSD